MPLWVTTRFDLPTELHLEMIQFLDYTSKLALTNLFILHSNDYHKVDNFIRGVVLHIRSREMD
jgi:hypothetical protein